MNTNKEHYYLMKNNSSIVEEIRRKANFNNGIKYIADSKSGIRWMTRSEFYNVPNGYRLVRFK
jgi:hypothetical protein